MTPGDCSYQRPNSVGPGSRSAMKDVRGTWKRQQHNVNYPRKEAIAAIDADGLLPDMLSYNP